MYTIFQTQWKITCWESHSKWEEWVHKYGVGLHPGDMVFWEKQEYWSNTEKDTSDVHLLAHLNNN